MALAERLKEARELKKYTQNEFALKLIEVVNEKYPEKNFSVASNTISNWENNISNPDAELLPFICQILNISANQLLDIDNFEEYENVDEFDGVYLKFKENYTVKDLSEEDKALLKATFNSIKKNKSKNN